MKIFLSNKSYGFLRVSGKDSKSFLNGQLSCNIEKLKERNPINCYYINIKGRISSSFIIYMQSIDDYVIFIRKDIVLSFLQDLTKYIMFLDVKVNDISEKLSSITIINSILEDEELYKLKTVNFRSKEKTLLFMHNSDEEYIYKYIIKYPGCEKINCDEYKYFNIKHGLFDLNVSTINKFLPNYTNILHNIDFSKGCFRGQEVIARIKNLSSVKKGLAILKKDNLEMSHIYNEKIYVDTPANKSVGEVVEFAMFKGDTYILVSIQLNLNNIYIYKIKSIRNIKLIRYI